MSAAPASLPLMAYRAVGTLAERFWAPRFLERRLARDKEHPTRWPERMGRVTAARPAGSLVWVHAASVGETTAILPLLAELGREGAASVLLTTGTVSSARLAEARLPKGARHQFVPLDLPRAVSGFLDHWRPDLGLLVESELWPGLVFGAAERHVPLALVNARMSERSLRRWSRFRPVARRLLSSFVVIAAQSEGDAERFVSLGAESVAATGNLKFDGPPPPADATVLEGLREAIGGRPVLGAASTHPGEEEMVLDAHAALATRVPGLLTLLAPRHPERAEEILALCAARGLGVARRSGREMPGHDIAILLFDTIGELGLLYRLAPVAFVGGSLVPHGGQNPLEPAKLGSAVLHGPHTHNFRDIYRTFGAERAALKVESGDALAAAAERLLLEPPSARAQAERARALVARSEGATRRTLDALAPLLRPLAA